MKQMESGEQAGETGMSLVSVVAAVLVFAVMVTALAAISVRSNKSATAMSGTNQAESNASTGLQEVYLMMTSEWQKEWASLGPNPSLTAAAQQINAFASWCSQLKIPGAPFSFTVQAPAGAGNVNPLPTARDVTHLYQDFTVTVTGGDGTNDGSNRTLTATIPLSGTIPSLNYAAYIPSDLFLLGGPELQGQIYADHVYVDNAVWTPDSHGSGENPTLWDIGWQRGILTSGGSKVQIDSGSTLNCVSVALFTRFKDQSYGHSDSNMFGKGLDVADAQDISANVSSYVDGNVSVQSAPQSTLSVSDIVSSQQQLIGQPGVTRTSVSPFDSLQTGSTVSSGSSGSGKGDSKDHSNGATSSHLYQLQADPASSASSVNGWYYSDGNLDVWGNVKLTAPLFVNGNLTVEPGATLNANNNSVYVTGDTRIKNLSMSTTTQTRMALYSSGNIWMGTDFVDFTTPGADSTVIHAFLASGGTIYLSGHLTLIGGLEANAVVVNSPEPVALSGDANHSGNSGHDNGNGNNGSDNGNHGGRGNGDQNGQDFAGNGSDKGSSLGWFSGWNWSWDKGRSDGQQAAPTQAHMVRIIFDNSFASQPMNGTPTVGDLQLQPLPQPTIVLG